MKVVLPVACVISCYFNIMMPKLHIYQHTYGYMHTHTHAITHYIMYIFRTCEIKEMNPYIGEQNLHYSIIVKNAQLRLICHQVFIQCM